MGYEVSACAARLRTFHTHLPAVPEGEGPKALLSSCTHRVVREGKEKELDSTKSSFSYNSEVRSFSLLLLHWSIRQLLPYS